MKSPRGLRVWESQGKRVAPFSNIQPGDFAMTLTRTNKPLGPQNPLSLVKIKKFEEIQGIQVLPVKPE